MRRSLPLFHLRSIRQINHRTVGYSATHDLTLDVEDGGEHSATCGGRASEHDTCNEADEVRIPEAARRQNRLSSAVLIPAVSQQRCWNKSIPDPSAPIASCRRKKRQKQKKKEAAKTPATSCDRDVTLIHSCTCEAIYSGTITTMQCMSHTAPNSARRGRRQPVPLVPFPASDVRR